MATEVSGLVQLENDKLVTIAVDAGTSTPLLVTGRVGVIAHDQAGRLVWLGLYPEPTTASRRAPHLRHYNAARIIWWE